MIHKPRIQLRTNLLAVIVALYLLITACKAAGQAPAPVSPPSVSGAPGLVATEACQSIVTFGAVADDTLADDQALQKGLETAPCLTLPPGLFLLDRGVTASKDNRLLTGAGPATILKFSNATDPRSTAPEGDRPGMINIVANSVSIRDLTIDQNFRGSKRRDGDVPIVGAITVGVSGGPKILENITVENVTFFDYYADAFAARRITTNNVLVSGCRFFSTFIVQGWKIAGIGGEQAISVSRGNNVVFTDNIINGALDDAIATHGEVYNATIANNTITTTGGRILVNGGHNVAVTGNTIRYIEDGATAIFVSREPSAGATMNDNVIVSSNSVTVNKGVKVSGALVHLLGPGKGVTVANNVLQREEAGGLGIRIADREFKGVAYGGESILIIGNHIRGATTGIAVHLGTPDSVKDIVIRENLVNGAEKGIHWPNPGDASVLSNNVFLNTAYQLWPPPLTKPTPGS